MLPKPETLGETTKGNTNIGVIATGEALDGSGAECLIDTVPHVAQPDGLRVLGNPIRVGGERLPSRAAPSLGADSDALLREVGYDSDQIAVLREQGVV